MKQVLGLMMIAVVALLGASSATAGDKKGVVVEFDNLTSPPGEWQEEKVIGALRFMQFKLPRVKDDVADAEIVIFKGISGSTKDNVDRWCAMFRAPEGKTLADVSKLTESKVAGVPVTTLDVHGTYLYKAKPFDPNAKTEPRPNYRMIGVVFDGEKTVYHIRFVGPATTVEHYRAGFEKWLTSFK